jgi:intraflagellar transport protein 80
MRLDISCKGNIHSELTACVGWGPSNELFSFSDDRTIHKWSASGDPVGKVSGE